MYEQSNLAITSIWNTQVVEAVGHASVAFQGGVISDMVSLSLCRTNDVNLVSIVAKYCVQLGVYTVPMCDGLIPISK